MRCGCGPHLECSHTTQQSIDDGLPAGGPRSRARSGGRRARSSSRSVAPTQCPEAEEMEEDFLDSLKQAKVARCPPLTRPLRSCILRPVRPSALKTVAAHRPKTARCGCLPSAASCCRTAARWIRCGSGPPAALGDSAATEWVLSFRPQSCQVPVGAQQDVVCGGAGGEGRPAEGAQVGGKAADRR